MQSIELKHCHLYTANNIWGAFLSFAQTMIVLRFSWICIQFGEHTADDHNEHLQKYTHTHSHRCQSMKFVRELWWFKFVASWSCPTAATTTFLNPNTWERDLVQTSNRKSANQNRFTTNANKDEIPIRNVKHRIKKWAKLQSELLVLDI